MSKLMNEDIKLVPIEGKVDKKSTKEFEHSLKIRINQMIKECEENHIPIFVTYYSNEEKYVFSGLMPEEINDPEIANQYGKFNEFFKTCLGFNKEEILRQTNIFHISE